MQDFSVEKNKSVILKELSREDHQKLVGAFVWLIEEDKRQNPELYKTKKQSYD